MAFGLVSTGKRRACYTRRLTASHDSRLSLTNPSGRPDVSCLELHELEAVLLDMGAAPFHARQFYRWIHQKLVTEIDQMTDLSRPLRERLAAAVTIDTPLVTDTNVSKDGTTKFGLRLSDGATIEAVYIPDSPGQTLCISTQVGCAIGCTFCLTGKMGLTRHLSAGEIAGQVRVLVRQLDLRTERFNIVLMGMGEPLHNYDQTMKSLRLLASTHGLGVSPRRVTLSTVGIVPALDRLATEPHPPNLAVSLHGTTDAQRDPLVPLNRRYPIDDVLAACRRFPLRRRDRITFEYVLLDGVNDTDADAHRLARLLHGIRSKINLLPLNEAPGIAFRRPDDSRVNRFATVLADHHLTVSVRKSRGRDIRAACGQLIVEGRHRSPAQHLARQL